MDTPAGWITPLTRMENVLPVGIVNTAARKRYMPTKMVTCTATMQPVTDAVRSWKATAIPDGAITPSAAIPALSADIPKPVLIPVHPQNTVIFPVHSISTGHTAIPAALIITM